MKNSTNKILAVAVVLLLAVNLVMVYMMVKNKGRRGEKREMRNSPNEMIKALDLNEDQKKAYEQLKEEHMKNSRALFDSVRSAKIAYFNLVKDSTVSDSTIRLYGDRVRERQSVADRMLFDHFRKVRQLFTAEQRLKFDSLVQKNMQRGPNGKRKKD